MEICEEYLSLALSVNQSDKDYQSHPYGKVFKNQLCGKHHAGLFMLLHKI